MKGIGSHINKLIRNKAGNNLNPAGVLFPVLLFAVLSAGAQTPQDLQPYVKLRHSFIVEAYQDPQIEESGLITDPGMLVSRKKEILNYQGGSGTIITPSGLILTNYHVYEKETKYEYDQEKNMLFKLIPASMNMYVFMLPEDDYLSPPELRYEAIPLCGDKWRDIMVLKVSHTPDGAAAQNLALPFTEPGNPFDLGLNEPITLIGYPGKGGETITVTNGKFLGYYREEGNQRIDGFIKTEASMSPGSSGGSAVHNDKLIGIPTLVSAPHLAGADFGFINPVTRAAPSLVKAHTHYGQDMPVMKDEWFGSKYNTDKTSDHIYITGKVRSNQTQKGIEEALVIFHKRELEQETVLNLLKEIRILKYIGNVKMLHKNGASMAEIAEYYEESESQIRTIIEMEVSMEDLSAGAVDMLQNGAFYFEEAATEPDGYFMCLLPKEAGLTLLVLAEDTREYSRSFSSGAGLYQDLGKVWVNEY